MKNASPSITDLASAVMDNGRRGMPKPGCDCVQCFGYCLIDKDKEERDRAINGPARNPAPWAPLVFEETT